MWGFAGVCAAFYLIVSFVRAWRDTDIRDLK